MKPKVKYADNEVLRYTGMMGHKVVGVTDGPDGPRMCCECNTVEEAKRLGADQRSLRIYRKGIGRNQWFGVYTRNETTIPPEPDLSKGE